MIGCCFQAIPVCAWFTRHSPFIIGSPLQNFHALWGEPFTLLRSTALNDNVMKVEVDRNCLNVVQSRAVATLESVNSKGSVSKVGVHRGFKRKQWTLMSLRRFSFGISDFRCREFLPSDNYD